MLKEEKNRRKRIITLVFIIVASMILSSCGCKNVEPLEPVTVEGHPHPATIEVALELGWGDGDYEVGYVTDKYRSVVEKGVEMIQVGPSQFCVDGEESIYVKDTMNDRILKYDKDGNFLGSVLISEISDKRAWIGPPYIYAGMDCCYLCWLDEDIIYRYRFQDREKKQIRFSDFGIGWIPHTLLTLYDGIGNVYFSEGSYSYTPDYQSLQFKYYKIDPSFTSIIEIREVPFNLWPINYVDDNSNFYSLSCKDEATPLSLYQLDNSGNISIIKEYSNKLEDNLVNKPIESREDLLFLQQYLGRYEGDECDYLSKDYEFVENIETGFIAVADGCQITRNANVYYMQYRPLYKDDKSPFRIYRANVAWDQTVE